MKRENFILRADSYGWSHPSMYRDNLRGLFAYLEARPGGEYDRTVWVGLQYILARYLEGVRVTREDIDEAQAVDAWHFAKPQLGSTEDTWWRIVKDHGGRLPLSIKAAPEGSVIPAGNALMTVEATDPAAAWLVGAVEPILAKVWYPMAVATRSWTTRLELERCVRETGGQPGASTYMLHDFGYRAASSEETAEIGGGAHLLSGARGTDTIVGMRFLQEWYGAGIGFAHSVAASQHSIMTQDGRTGEIEIAKEIVRRKEGQILSLVADSYDYYRFVDAMIANKDLIDYHKVTLVLRPDSVTPTHNTPEDVVAWTLHRLAEKLPVTETRTGHKRVAFKVLWGDGLDAAAIARVATRAVENNFAADNLVFGMGGGLLQKVNRDTNRVKYAVSARLEGEQWVPMSKDPLDASKRSKAGRVTLTRVNGYYKTEADTYGQSVLQEVFRDGLVLRQATFHDVRARAELQLIEDCTSWAAARGL